VHHHLQLPATRRPELPGLAARRSASGTVSELKVTNDIDFWNPVNSRIPKSAGG